MIDVVKREISRLCNYYKYDFEISGDEVTIYGHVVTRNKRLKLITNQILEHFTNIGFRPTIISCERGKLKAVFKLTEEASYRYYKNRVDII